jgi:LSD1 subclass zinc finger protein
MAIEFVCSGCENTLRVPDEHAGKQARCPQCQTLNLIQAGISYSEVEEFRADIPTQNPNNLFGDAVSIGTSMPSAANPPNYSSNPYEASNANAGTYQRPHRGGVILALGIAGLMCPGIFIPGILAVIMGYGDLKKISAGSMNPEGRGLTQAGLIIGAIGLTMGLLFCAFYGLMAFVLAGVEMAN